MARDFNGTNTDYLTASSPVITSIPILSFSFWFYADSVSQYKNIISMEMGSQDLRMEFDGGWGWVFAYPKGSDACKWSIPTPSTGSWQNLVVTYDSTSDSNDAIFYIDGVSKTVTERNFPAGSFVTTMSNIRLGGSQTLSQMWDGRLAEFGMWNRQLTAAEAAILGKGFSPAFIRNGLTSYAPLIGRNSPENDLRYGSNFTVTGTSNTAHPRIIYPSNYQLAPFAPAAAANTQQYLTMMGIGS